MQNLLGHAERIRSQGAFYHRNKAYDLSGPEALLYADRAGILSPVLGRKVSFVSPPGGEWKAAVLALGFSEWLADALIDFQHHAVRGNAQRVSPAVQELTGRAPISFRRFVEDHVEMFR